MTTSEDVPLLTVDYETLTCRADGGPSPMLLDAIAEMAFDIAHENCDEDGCTAGGLPWWRGATEIVLMAVAEHMRLTTPPAVPAAAAGPGTDGGDQA